MASWTDKARAAADEIVETCRQPPTLVDLLARVTSRKRRPGVISDDWSYRNQLLVAIRGYQEARGFRPWQDVGRKVKKGQKAFYIIAPRLVKKPDQDGKADKGKSDSTTDAKRGFVLIGYRAVPVFGLEQTEPDVAWTEQPAYHPLYGETGETQLVADGFRVPWWEWYSEIRQSVLDIPAAELAAAIVAKLIGQTTELNDLLYRLSKHQPFELAEHIDTACRAVAEYLSSYEVDEFHTVIMRHSDDAV